MTTAKFEFALYADAFAHRHPRLLPRRWRDWLCDQVDHRRWFSDAQ